FINFKSNSVRNRQILSTGTCSARLKRYRTPNQRLVGNGASFPSDYRRAAIYAERIRNLQSLEITPPNPYNPGPVRDVRMAPIIVLFTDFGLEGPYIGQVKTVLHRVAPGVPVIDLFADLPPANPQPAAFLLAAYAVWFSTGTVILAVVDPGVGGARG